jgi:HAD superfamily hydrolase (TIGR01509 family)
MERDLKHKMLRDTDLVPSIGVVAFLDALKLNGYTLAIASSSLKRNVDLILGKLKLTAYFDFIVSGEQVTKGKPEPDIFLKVAEHYGLHPNECVVIEDSTNGVAAAKAAGMHCLAYFNPTSGEQDLSKADQVFKSFADTDVYSCFGCTSSAEIGEPSLI